MKMVFDSKVLSIFNQKQLLAQLLVATLFVCLSLRLLFFRPSGFDSDLGTSEAMTKSEGYEDRAAHPPELPDRIRRPFGGVNETNRGGKCDLFVGDWVPDQSGPFYTNETCKLIEGDQNCMRNGRPDTGYLYWRWKPRDCELPRLDPRRFLDLMRNKNWALVGDSISRNHVQSFLCILSTVEQAVEIYYGNSYKSKKWTFPRHNFTVSVVWSPFLTEASIFEDDNGVSSSEVQLHLDRLDNNWSEPYKAWDYTIISSGQWFLKQAVYHENDVVLGCHACRAARNLTELGFPFAYRRSLRTVLTFLAGTRHGGTVFFRTSAPDHFEGGEWHDGGDCPRRAPMRVGGVEVKELGRYLRDVELEEFERVEGVAREGGVDLRLLDLMGMSILRPDGHPGAYRRFHPFSGGDRGPNDCLHWCLPGPIDAWNDVIAEMIVNG